MKAHQEEMRGIENNKNKSDQGRFVKRKILVFGRKEVGGRWWFS